ncbi:MAG: hypothetical protein RMH77_01585 [Sulfolobales archaeon]|nr:hypothetical protein [Sulfolobales archaeon]MCX8186532.1 hypothetical protein [Sulfolobales archaeon]MDW7969080.1 hypothetical protein [Sulfolobales archaeon]
MRVLIPLHITGFWYVVKSYSPVFTGSLGAGLTLDPPIIAEASEGSCKLTINNTCIETPVISTAERIANLELTKGINVKSKVMLGNGYGLSAATTLSYLTLNMLDKDVTLNHISTIAHVAEVLNETGYGDVIAEFYGNGLVLRTSPGPPGIGSVDLIPIKNSLKVITVPLGNLTTKEMMSKYGSLINTVGIDIYRKFVEEPSIESFAELSHEFSLRVGMLSKDLNVLLGNTLTNFIRNGSVLGYYVKKRLLTVIAESDYLHDITTALTKTVGKPKIFNIARHGLIVM